MSTTASPATLTKVYNISITSQNSFMLLFSQLHSISAPDNTTVIPAARQAPLSMKFSRQESLSR